MSENKNVTVPVGNARDSTGRFLASTERGMRSRSGASGESPYEQGQCRRTAQASSNIEPSKRKRGAIFVARLWPRYCSGSTGSTRQPALAGKSLRTGRLHKLGDFLVVDFSRAWAPQAWVSPA